MERSGQVVEMVMVMMVRRTMDARKRRVELLGVCVKVDIRCEQKEQEQEEATIASNPNLSCYGLALARLGATGTSAQNGLVCFWWGRQDRGVEGRKGGIAAGNRCTSPLAPFAQARFPIR